ncbi:MAG: hypothetical protein HY763_05020 [Planctomycetes bacterium]|nr:hypothetical protein [Planctomycetota bacterium]
MFRPRSYAALLCLLLLPSATPVWADDRDQDGVDDAADVCCGTPPNVAVDAEGRPLGDIDRDCDTDLEDYALLQSGLSGPGQRCCEDNDCDDGNPCTVDRCDPVADCVHTLTTGAGPTQSSTIAVNCDSSLLVNVNPDNDSISVFTTAGSQLVRQAEIPVGRDPRSVAVLDKTAYVANSRDGTVSVVDLVSHAVTGTIPVGSEPMGVAPSPNGTWILVTNSASNSLTVLNVELGIPVITVDLSSFGSSPRAVAVTNDGDTDDLDETIFVAMFFGQLRPGKSAVEEGQDDQREGHIVAISGTTLVPVGAPNPVVLGPLAATGFNANGKLLPAGVGPTPAVPSTNPQTFTTPTGAYPNQLAAIAIHPSTSRGYVVSTAASPNGPLRFNSMVQGLVSVFDGLTRTEITAAQADPLVRRTAPLNLNQGINLSTTPAPRLFLSNPVAMAWRPDGSDAWVAVQNSDAVVRLTVDAGGAPTIGAPLVAGPSNIVRADLRTQAALQTPSEVPHGIVISRDGGRAYVSNLISRSVTTIDISNPTAPAILGTVPSADLPTDPVDLVALVGASLFYTGRGPQERMSSESWGGCIACHPNGRSDNVTWAFDAGPRQTIPLDGMFNKNYPFDQRILNWSAVRDENHDFELNTRGVFGGRGLIDDDRLFLAMGGATGATPADSALIEQFHQATGVVGTTNDLAAGAGLPSIILARRDFAVATLSDDRVFIIGGRTGGGQGTLVPAVYSLLELDPRTNTLSLRNSTGFTRRHSLGAAAVRTAEGVRIYAIGGYTGTTGAEQPVSTVEEYDPATDSWRTVSSLPTAVAQFGVTVAGGINSAEPHQLIHVVSGNTSSENAPSVANANPVQRFQADPLGAGTWTGFNPAGLTLRRNHGATTALRGVSSRVFVVGGMDAAGAVVSFVEEYVAQGVTVAQTVHTSLPAPRASFGIGSSLSTNQIYVAGGVDDTGADQATVFEYSIANNGPVAGPVGTPSGTWVTRANLSAARRGLQLSTPPGVTNFLPVANIGRNGAQDAIAVWIAREVRAARAPVAAADPAAAAGRVLFGTPGLVVPGVSCATCHGGPKWTRSTVDYFAPPSPDVGLGLGSEKVIGAELRQTITQGGNVLNNVGTFTLAGGRQNEIRFNGADISQAINPLGANGFNIPSLFSVHETAPYFYSGLAQTLNEVLDGSQDGFGGTRQHFVANAAQRAQLVAFLRSIDETTPTFP